MNTWWRGVHRETKLTCFHFSIVLYKLLINVYVDRLLKHIEVIGYNIFYWKDRTWKGKLLCRLMQPYHWSYKLLLEIASMFEPGRCLDEAATVMFDGDVAHWDRHREQTSANRREKPSLGRRIGDYMRRRVWPGISFTASHGGRQNVLVNK
jgi:hypothetical protein